MSVSLLLLYKDKRFGTDQLANTASKILPKSRMKLHKRQIYDLVTKGYIDKPTAHHGRGGLEFTFDHLVQVLAIAIHMTTGKPSKRVAKEKMSKLSKEELLNFVCSYLEDIEVLPRVKTKKSMEVTKWFRIEYEEEELFKCSNDTIKMLLGIVYNSLQLEKERKDYGKVT